MNILQILWKNLQGGPVTLRYPQVAVAPETLRGIVHNDPQICIGCGICVYVCAPGALDVLESNQAFEWRYDPGQCTFCGRCAADCPAGALQMYADRPAVYRHREEIVQTLRMPFHACERCGRPMRPVSAQVLHRAFPETSPAIEGLIHLCPDCRRKQAQSAFVTYASTRDKL
jgi:formate hydrogenlyase subunit 6/NADH:ubiquinone oxidoreductase subunit I